MQNKFIHTTRRTLSDEQIGFTAYTAARRRAPLVTASLSPQRSTHTPSQMHALRPVHVDRKLRNCHIVKRTSPEADSRDAHSLRLTLKNKTPHDPPHQGSTQRRNTHAHTQIRCLAQTLRQAHQPRHTHTKGLTQSHPSISTRSYSCPSRSLSLSLLSLPPSHQNARARTEVRSCATAGSSSPAAVAGTGAM